MGDTSTGYSWLGEKSLLAVVPATAYLMDYMYQLGATEAFDVPSVLIDISIPRVLSLAALIILLLPLAFFALDWYWQLLRKEITPFTHQLLLMLPILFLVAMFAAINWRRYCWVLAFALGLCVFFLVLFKVKPTAIHSRTVSLYLQLFSLSSITRVVGDSLIKLLMTAGLLVVLSFELGTWTALHKVEFLVLSTDPEKVVLLQYRHRMICAPLDRERKSFLTSFTIFDPSEDARATFRPERVGPLKGRAPPTKVGEDSDAHSGDIR